MRFSLLSTLALLTLALAPIVRADDKAPAKPHDYAKWEKEIAAFEAADAKQAPPKNAIVFVGSSSIRMWKTLAEDFPKHQVINRGFGGSEIADSTYFADRIVIPYAPRMIVFYAGGNDINAGEAPDAVVADFKTFVAKVREKLPETEIAFISVAGNPSRWAQVEKVRQVNHAIAAWIKDQPHMKFIDVFPKMLGEDGQPKPDIFIEDKLHMNAAGYKIWVEIVRPFLPPPDR